MDIYDVWNESLEAVKQQVTGVGPWTALNTAVPIILEDDKFVLGFRPDDVELMGHLKMAGTQRAIETEVGKRAGRAVNLVVLDGITIQAWMAHKRLKEKAEEIKVRDFEKQKVEVAASRAWEDLYDQLSREYAEMPNKSMPQQRAKLLDIYIDLVVEQLRGAVLNEDGDRNYARCLDRIGTYCDVSPVIIAIYVSDRIKGR